MGIFGDVNKLYLTNIDPNNILGQGRRIIDIIWRDVIDIML